MPAAARRIQTRTESRLRPRAAQRERSATAAHMIQRLSHGTPADPIISRKNRSESVSLSSGPPFGLSTMRSSWMIAASVCAPYELSNHRMYRGIDARSVGFSSRGVNVRASSTLFRASSGLLPSRIRRSVSILTTDSSLNRNEFVTPNCFLSIWMSPTTPLGSSTSKPDFSATRQGRHVAAVSDESAISMLRSARCASQARPTAPP
jgi:hypothetical protein